MENNTWLSRAECSALRGIAILGIMLHNFCHWLSIPAKENEYLYRVSNNEGLLGILAHPDAMLPINLVSYFGHYGVPVFLFLSGYGLVMKYGDRPDLPVFRFIRYHYLKLLTMLFTGFAAFTLVDLATPRPFHYTAGNIIAQLLMYINLLPWPSRSIWPGPYWFFGLMIQLYIVYRLFIHRRGPAVVVGLVLVCWLLQAVCGPEDETLRRLRYNCVGGMLPFCAGVLLGRSRPAAWMQCFRRWQWALLCMATTGVLSLMCFNFQTWLWAPLFAVAATVFFVKSLPAVALPPLLWTGGVSAVMFVTHPIARKIFIPVSINGEVYAGLLLYIIGVVAIAGVFELLMDKIPKPKSPIRSSQGEEK